MVIIGIDDLWVDWGWKLAATWLEDQKNFFLNGKAHFFIVIKKVIQLLLSNIMSKMYVLVNKRLYF
jgi:hypothetical protein